ARRCTPPGRSRTPWQGLSAGRALGRSGSCTEAARTKSSAGLWATMTACVLVDTVFSCCTHLVFVTKFRHRVFADRHLIRLEEIMPVVCADFEVELAEFNGGPDPCTCW